MKSLKNSGILSDNVFAFYLSRRSIASSFLDLGAVVNSHMKDPSNLFMMPIKDESYHWTLEVTGIGFGDMEANAYRVSVEAITDSGTSCLVISDFYYFWIMKKLAEKGLVYFSVDESNPYL